MKNLKVYNVLKNNKYKLCVGIIGIATVTSILAGDIIKENNLRTDYQTQIIKPEENYSSEVELCINDILEVNDVVSLVREGNIIEDIIIISSENKELLQDYVSKLPIGNYKVISNSLGEIEFEINSEDEKFILNLDYQTKKMTVFENEKEITR